MKNLSLPLLLLITTEIKGLPFLLSSIYCKQFVHDYDLIHCAVSKLVIFIGYLEEHLAWD